MLFLTLCSIQAHLFLDHINISNSKSSTHQRCYSHGTIGRKPDFFRQTSYQRLSQHPPEIQKKIATIRLARTTSATALLIQFQFFLLVVQYHTIQDQDIKTLDAVICIIGRGLVSTPYLARSGSSTDHSFFFFFFFFCLCFCLCFGSSSPPTFAWVIYIPLEILSTGVLDHMDFLGFSLGGTFWIS